MAHSPTASAGHIPLLTKTLYGAGSMATGVKDTAFNVFLLFYYTQVVGLSGSLAGTAIFTALVLDAISDPLVGFWSDRLQSHWGRRHPFIYASALPMGIAFYFLFNPPAAESQSVLFAWMLVFAVLVRFFMTFYAVPSSALTAEMTSDYDERTSLSGFRVLLGWLGGLAFATVGYVVLFAPNETYEDGRLDPAAYQDFALLGAGVIVIAILVCALGTHHLIPRLKQVAENAQESLGLRNDLSNMLHNRPFLVLVAIIFVTATAIGFTDVMGLYMFTYFWGLSTDQLAVLTLAALLGTIAAFLAAPVLSKRFDKRPVAMASAGLVMLCYPACIALRLAGVLPENGDPAILMILCGNATLTVFAAVSMTILFASMIADTIDKNELATGRRQEAIYSSAFTFSMKATSGLGGFIAGIALDLVGFPTGADTAEISAATQQSLGAAVAGIIFTFWCIALLTLRAYRLTREDHAAILSAVTHQRQLGRSPAFPEAVAVCPAGEQ